MKTVGTKRAEETGGDVGQQTSTTSLRVRYADTDAQGIVYHGSFFTFFEVARLDLLILLLGAEADATNLWARVAIASARCDYKAVLRYPEEITIIAAVVKVGTTSFKVRYEVLGPRGDLVAEGATVQVYLGADGQPVPLSEGLGSSLSAGLGHAARRLDRRR